VKIQNPLHDNHNNLEHEGVDFGGDWAVKKNSEYGVDDGFVAKFNMAIENVNEQPGKHEAILKDQD
jgi:hypothetical protein